MSGKRLFAALSLVLTAAPLLPFLHASAEGVSERTRAELERLSQAPPEFSEHGLRVRHDDQAAAPTIVATADLDTIRASESYWRQIVHTNGAFGDVIYTVAYNLDAEVAIATAHGLLLHVPGIDSYHVRLVLAVPSSTGKKSMVALEFDYGRDVDTPQYKDDDPGTVDPVKDTPNTGPAPWLVEAIHRENGGGERVLTPEDVLLDKDSLKGKTIAVSGFTACANTVEACMLYSDVMNFTKNIFYDASSASREDRAKLLACSIVAGCRVTLRGIVVNEPLKTLVVTSMAWNGGLVSAPPDDAAARETDDGPISVKDFMLDRRKLIGRTVTIVGDAQCDGSSCWLTQSGWLSQQVASFDASALAREDRRHLLDCDQAFSSGCQVEVTGRVTSNGMTATGIVWKK